MRGRLVALVGALVCVTAASLAAQNTLVFFASVVDDKGVPVATLAPDDLKVVENGAEGKIVKSHERQSHQFRLTFQRPNGASGAMGQIGAQIRAGLNSSLTINGRLP